MNETEELPLREAKRRATRAAIEEHATTMVAERGFDHVTVEDICAQVGISKRTFFNYVDSKETAVFGDPPRLPTAEEKASFLGSRQPHLLNAVLELCSATALSTQLLESPRATEILRRRKEIRHRNPELILQRHSSFHEIHLALKALLQEYYEIHPDALITGSSLEQEANTLVSIASSSLQLGYMSWLNGNDNSPIALNLACTQALSDITTLIEGQPKE
ncbi:Transcriptional regulator, TetR family [Corynebacterium occultum]|uniref:Transcriptional regulator, TetR family n=1 Tax=Corynebacterium occultum TaxID=2675219 RepID=A0A6B8VRY8_9CORY|nr:TetR family transcriptional regulator [Corynebacterium occultum]QGU06883.1 Transcriptional regulator, TetR family [Corynebacterium occultum]